MGFSKMEGTTVNIKDKIAYSALQNIQDSMVKTGKGWNAASGIALDKANPEKVSNPDNLKFSEKLRTLFIGEDRSIHVNNFLWAYNFDTQELSRLMPMPVGAEATGLHVVDDLNGWTYIMSNFQHAGDWILALHGKVQATLDPLVRANYKDRFGAAVGYLTADLTGIKLA